MKLSELGGFGIQNIEALLAGNVDHTGLQIVAQHTGQHEGLDEGGVDDVNVGVTQVDLSVRVPKYRCKSCDATPNHEFESIVPNRQLTKRLLTQIKVEAFRGNFEDVATNYGISPTVVASIFDAYAEELEGKRGVVSIGYWLAIDEKHVDHKMRGILVDGEDGILLEMTEDTKPETIKKAIMSLNGYEKVRYVTTDMAGF